MIPMMNSDADPQLEAVGHPGKPREERSQTAILTPRRRRKGIIPGIFSGEASFGDSQREVILIIRGMVERLLLTENQPVVLGRSDLSTRFHPDVDMTPYGAVDRGVSRAHARLHIEGRKLYVTDLGSTNGTYISNKKLTPNKPQVLRKGEDLMLGRLSVRVLFH
jgi:hypothetical protein